MQPLERNSHIAQIFGAISGFLCLVVASISLWWQVSHTEKSSIGSTMSPVLIYLGIGFLFVLGFSFVIIAIVGATKPSPVTAQSQLPQPPISQKQEMNNSGNATMTNSGNPTATAEIKQYIGYPAPQMPLAAPPEDEELPQLEFVDAKEIFLGFSQAAAYEITSGTHVGLVAKFKNPSQEVRAKNVDAFDVVGNVEYRNASGEREHAVCAWVEHKFQGIDIKAGRSQRLIVLFRDRPGSKLQALSCENDAMPITMGRLAYLRALQSLKWPLTKDIVQDCNELEIVLIGNDGHTLFRGRFGLVLAEEKIRLRKY